MPHPKTASPAASSRAVKRQPGLPTAASDKTWKLSYLGRVPRVAARTDFPDKARHSGREVKRLFADLRIGQGVGFKALDRRRPP